MALCETCGLDDSLAVEQLVRQLKSWSVWQDAKVIPDPQPGVVAKVFQDIDMEADSYGDYVSGEVYMIFKVGDKFYRKNGTVDSYGGITWGGSFREAKQKKVEVVRYE